MLLRALLPVIEVPGRLLVDSNVPPVLFQATVRAGSCSAMASAAVEKLVPVMVLSLSRHVARRLTLARARVAALPMLLLTAGAAMALVTSVRALDKFQHRTGEGILATSASVPLQTAPATRIARKDVSGTVVIRGRVVGPDGQPMQDAQVVLSLPQLSASEIRSCESIARSGADGGFQTTVPRERLEQLEQLAKGRLEPTLGPILGAFAPGFAIGWIRADLGSVQRGQLTIALLPDDVLIEGQIRNLEGRPVAGLDVRPISVVAVKPGFLEKLRVHMSQMDRTMRDAVRDGVPLGEHGPIPPVKSDAAGRFQLRGIGRDRLALLFIAGDGIERSEALVFTTSDPDYKPVPPVSNVARSLPVHGPRFELIAAPGRAVQGVVLDAETRQPITAAKVVLYGLGLTASTDPQGRFRITGHSRQPGLPDLVGVEVDGQPFVKVVQPIGAPRGPDAVHTEVALKRGAWVEGRVVDRATGKPVQAVVEYCPYADNPHLQEYAGASFLDHNIGDEAVFPTDAQGRFRAVALPGGGVLGVRTADDSYLSAEPFAPQLAGRLVRFPGFRQAARFQAMLPIEVKGRESLTVLEIKVARGRATRVRMLGSDGKPLSGATVVFLDRHPLAIEPVVGTELTFTHTRPGEAESLVVLHEQQGLGGCVEINGDEADPIAVTLRALGTVKGRLVNEKGLPRANVQIQAMYLRDQSVHRHVGQLDAAARTGPDGSFQIQRLVPGLFYSFEVLMEPEQDKALRSEGYLQRGRWALGPQPRDWGDVQVKKNN